MRYVVDIDASDAAHIRGTVAAAAGTRSFLGWLELISILEREPQPAGDGPLGERDLGKESK